MCSTWIPYIYLLTGVGSLGDQRVCDNRSITRIVMLSALGVGAAGTVHRDRGLGMGKEKYAVHLAPAD